MRTAIRKLITNSECTNDKMTFADRAFSVAIPKNWNNLLDYLRRQKDSKHFKKQLKTYLFKSVFDQ